jgi:hypothetical protein
MLTSLLIFYITLVVISFCLKTILYDPNLVPKSKTSSASTSEPTPNKRITKDGGWKVQMQKPKREIAVVGCNTEGEVVREILLMGHRSDDIKDIIQL